MTAHNHREYVEGCFRCDLSRDELGLASDESGYEEATPAEARRLAMRELDRAKAADSLEHFAMHLKAASIWARDAVWP